MDTGQLIWIIAVTILSLLNIVWQFDLQTRQRRLRERYGQLFSNAGGAGTSLEALMSHIEGMQERIGTLDDTARQIHSTLGHSIQGFGMVRFQAFQNTGGDQSFAMALVDGAGNGLVVSALYAREGTRIYGKPLEAWSSMYSLTDEEKQALDKAHKMVQAS
jgi:hypothetical protein